MTTQQEEPKKDPYEVLGVSFPASDADIRKAYRKRALQLHPDKQPAPNSQQSAREREAALNAIQEAFQDLQTARAFLLEPDFQEARQRYDRKRASQDARRQLDQQRRQNLTDQRKQRLDDLQRAEAQARREQQQSSKDRTKKRNRSSREEEQKLGKLRKEGSDLRQAFADRAEAKERQDTVSASRREKTDCQIRLKWSRKRVPSHRTTITALTELLADKFGKVLHVEYLGKQGNAALVTFENVSSAKDCIAAYASSKDFRATTISGNGVLDNDDHKTAIGSIDDPTETLESTRDAETVQAYQRRRTAARQEELNKMQEEEEGHESSELQAQVAWVPPSIPKTAASGSPTSWWNAVEQLEALVLIPLLPPDEHPAWLKKTV